MLRVCMDFPQTSGCVSSDIRKEIASLCRIKKGEMILDESLMCNWNLNYAGFYVHFILNTHQIRNTPLSFHFCAVKMTLVGHLNLSLCKQISLLFNGMFKFV